MAEQFGSIIGVFFIWALVPAIIGLIQWARTRDSKKVSAAAFSWWSIILAFGFLFLSFFAQYVQRFS